PDLHQRIPDVPWHVAAEVERQRPVHDRGQHAAGEGGERELAPAESCQFGGPQTRQSSRDRGGAGPFRLGPLEVTSRSVTRQDLQDTEVMLGFAGRKWQWGCRVAGLGRIVAVDNKLVSNEAVFLNLQRTPLRRPGVTP